MGKYLTAAEAREILYKKGDLEEVLKTIKNKAEHGSSKLVLGRYVSDESITKLKELGYTVKTEYYIDGSSCVIISW